MTPGKWTTLPILPFVLLSSLEKWAFIGTHISLPQSSAADSFVPMKCHLRGFPFTFTAPVICCVLLHTCRLLAQTLRWIIYLLKYLH